MTNWKQKLTSRKLWMAVAGFVSMLLIAFGVAETEAAQITAIILAGADVLGYIIAEGLVDAKAANGNADNSVAVHEEEEYIAPEVSE